MEKQLTLIAAGDVCMKKVEDKVDAAYAAWVLEKVRPLLDGADLRICNLECPLTDCEEMLPKSGPNIKGIPKNVEFLTEGRFDCAILANNHTGDYGQQGVFDTLEVLKKAGVGLVGAGKDIDEAYQPWYIEKNGIRLGIVALCENEFGVATRKLAGVAGFQIGRAQRAIQEAKKNAEFVVVVFHGGNENNPLPSPRVKERYHLLADLGADAVIGMHPHCPQGYEVYNNVPIVYSVGNFFFYDPYPDLAHSWHFGYLPELTFRPGEPVGLEIHPYHFIEGDGQVLPLEGKEKENMMAYLEKISGMFADDENLEKYFRAWCTITGPVYAEFLMYRSDYTVDARLRREKCFNDLRNNLTCEAHNELLTGLLLLEERGEWEEALALSQELKDLQYIHI